MPAGDAKDLKRANAETREAWDRNAAHWDRRMAEGNDFFSVLLWPSIVRLLNPRAGDRVLDVACGNGVTSRRLAALGADVDAFDFSEEMICHARRRTREYLGRVQYRVLDATDEDGLRSLGAKRYDAALCNMGLFDIADVEPLMRTLPGLLRSRGRFVFSVIHPCFNSPHTVKVAESMERDGQIVTDFSVRVTSYLRSSIEEGLGMAGQPVPQLIFHRPLQTLLAPAFEAGFVLDGLEERAFPPDHPASDNPLAWGGNYSEFPPVIVIRLRLGSGL